MTTAPQEPIDIVRAFIAAIAVKDFDTAVQYVAADCEYDNVPIIKVEGPEGVRAVLEPAFAPTLENEWVILREAAVGPLVFMERLDRHRFAHGWGELPIVGVWEVHDGLITVWREYFDRATLEAVFAPAD